MTTKLCGARYRHNRGLTCGKEPGHLEADPLHKFDPDDPASMEWFDYDTADREPVPVLPPARPEEDVVADPHRLGWTFDQDGSRWGRG